MRSTGIRVGQFEWTGCGADATLLCTRALPSGRITTALETRSQMSSSIAHVNVWVHETWLVAHCRQQHDTIGCVSGARDSGAGASPGAGRSGRPHEHHAGTRLRLHSFYCSTSAYLPVFLSLGDESDGGP